MKIGLYCTNNIPYPVPSDTIYANMSITGALADQLAEEGHDVTFFAPEGTQTKAQLVTFDMQPFSQAEIYTQYPHYGSSYQYENLMMIQALNYMEDHHFDLFHSHCRPFSVLNFAPLKPQLPTVVTFHDPLDSEGFKILPLYNMFANIHYVSISENQRKPFPDLNWISTVYNGIDTNFWEFNAQPDDYLLFVGRIMPEKGTDIAVQVALQTGKRLKIVGSCYEKDQRFFEQTIKPYLGEQIEYLGILPKEQLKPLYQNALALINPIRWKEPFGLVMIEAMSCGTPVIASNTGSLKEIVVHRETGFITNTDDIIQDFVSCVHQLSYINRVDCRQHVMRKFSIEMMKANYLDTYRRVKDEK